MELFEGALVNEQSRNRGKGKTLKKRGGLAGPPNDHSFIEMVSN